MMAQRSGQYSLIEQVVLFALGISITIGFLVAFEDLTADIQADVGETQTQLVSRYVASGAVELVESDSEGRFVISLPGTVADQVYVLRLTQDGVEIETTGQRYTAALYGLANRISTTGAIESRAGGVRVTFDDGTLELGEN